MSRVPIGAGPFDIPGMTVRHSGIRWLRGEGGRCRRGEVVAYCNLGLFSPAGPRPFAEEWRDLQVGFATPAAGRLRRSGDVSAGGNLDRMEYARPWTPDLVLGHLDYAFNPAPGPARLLMVAGQRMTELAEVRSGLLTGWHGQVRGWWGESAAGFGTLLGLGTCEQGGILRGDGGAFQEMFEATEGPAQVVFVPDDVLVPCARIVLEQVQRTEAQRQAIAADMLQSLVAGPASASPADWLFLGALLTSLLASPATRTFDVLTRRAMTQTGPAQAILLSVESELRDVLRHRRLGYTVCCHDFRLRELSPAVSAWFRTQFEPVRRSTGDIRADYDRLLDAIGARVLVLNKAVTAPFQAVQSYAGFAQPLGDALSDIRDQDLNLMLHDLERQRGVALVDVDRIAAELGTQAHIPDRIHQSGALQRAVRGELLHVLRRLGIPGFGPRVN